MSQRDMPRGFVRYATASRFWQILLQPNFKSGLSGCDACNMPIGHPNQPLLEVPILANGLDGESSKIRQNCMEILFLHRWLLYCTDQALRRVIFLAEKRAHDL
jgi:hypothetical protein